MSAHSSNAQSTPNYKEALRLDLSIVEALLKRARCGHAKAKYFQRTAMAVKALQRSSVLQVQDTLDALQQSIQSRKQVQKSDQWDAASLASSVLDTESLQTLHQIHATLQEEFPALISRIQYASEVLFAEISRGFFLPFCTVALGALARIRVLVMRIAHSLLDQLQQVQEEVGHNKDTPQNWFLSNEEAILLRKQFTEPEEVKPMPRQERFRLVREKLGFPYSKQQQANAAALTQEGEEEESEGDANSESSSDMPKAAMKVDSNVDDASSHNDLGQPILSGTDEASTSVASSAPSSLPSSRSVSPATPAMMKFMQDNKDKKKKKKDKKDKKKKDKKRKSSSSPTPSSKEKKKSKKDFFDDLFG